MHGQIGGHVIKNPTNDQLLVRMNHQFLVMLWLLLCSCPGALAGTAKTSTLAAYQLKQRQAELGLVTVLVGDGGLRATNEARGYVIVSRPPKWDVTIARPKEKMVASMPVDKWCQSSTLLVMLAAGAWDGDFSTMPSVACSVCAIPGLRYVASYTKPMRSPRDILVDDNLMKTRRYRAKTILTVLSLKVPAPAQRILERLYGTPHATGIPAIFENVLTDGQINHALTTLECKNVQAPADYFSAPKDYRKVDVRMLILSPDERSDFDNLGRDMDLGRSFGKAK